MRGNWNGFHSVRIDIKNRIVFRILDDTMEIVQCGSHYGDK
ncbi:toxin-antitoxin system, toxin component, RelE family [Fusobacterium necrophorum subsp. funduliforme Fnf 1007]|uniref:Toxin-antitoxin system, toxin component, RelE family n=1 Tax=Fusobacterium necrophorum subsp. funduliforme Fnf 1007 TaxID=1161424 RepID=A0AAN3VW56_9FUSO|nr:toxin-antitoxin system, toxin component, RelE family [Fusobacterium necrophorum subsp. funduliforme Fnf 1007]